jgi:hypothetical protein
MKKQALKARRACLDLLPGDTSPVIISNDDNDLVSVSELFARADPAPTTVTTITIPTAGIYKRQMSEEVPRDERPNGRKTIPAAPQQEASEDSQEAQGQI